MEQDFKAVLQEIKATDKAIFEQAIARLNTLAKPPGSLGRLEEIAAKLCAITGSPTPNIDKRCVLVLAADNGVAAENISSAPQSVTATHTINIVKGITGVGVLAKTFHADVFVADVGVAADLNHPRLLNKKIRKSTGNIAKEPAMTKAEAEQALMTGIEMAVDAKKLGYQLIGVGEMGIGNTTTSSAVLSALLSLSPEEVGNTVGKGAGLSDAAYARKVQVIQSALALRKPDKNDPVDVLQKVGGLDLAAMAGVFIGAAWVGLPVVIDGFASIVAALCAVGCCPGVKDYLFASHHSFERGYALALSALGLSASLSLDMRLGEGSGCPLMFGLMDGAVSVLRNMATFDEAQIDTAYMENINQIDGAF